jgi:hypothetical protein
MTKILTALIAAFLFIGCNSTAGEQNVEPKLVVGKSLNLNLNNQFEKAQNVPADTKTVIFAFSKDSAHTCNDYFETKAPAYLAQHKTIFVADVSSAPSLIRSMFIMPGLKDFKHTVLVLDDKSVAAGFRAKMNTEEIVVVSVENSKITNIKTINSTKDLITSIEAK